MPFPSDPDNNPWNAFIRGRDADGNPIRFFSGEANVVKKLLEQHHLITESIVNEALDDAEERFHKLFSYAQSQGFDPNDFTQNRVWLPSNNTDALRLGSAKHNSRHDSFNRFINEKLAEIDAKILHDIRVNNITEAQAYGNVRKILNGLAQQVKEMLGKVDANGNPLLVLNNTDPRLPAGVTADDINIAADNNFKLFEFDANTGQYVEGNMIVGGDGLRASTFTKGFDGDLPGTYGHTLDFDADGQAGWDVETRARIIEYDRIINELPDGTPLERHLFLGDDVDQRIVERINLLNDPDMFPPDVDMPNTYLQFETAVKNASANASLNNDRAVLNKVLDYYDKAIDSADAVFKTSYQTVKKDMGLAFDEFSKIVKDSYEFAKDPRGRELDADTKLKLKVGAGAMVLGALSIHSEFQVAKIDNPDLTFGDFVLKSLPGLLLAAPIAYGLAKGAAILAATGPVGATIVIAAVAAFTIYEVLQIADNYAQVVAANFPEPPQPDEEWTPEEVAQAASMEAVLESLQTAIKVMQELDDGAGSAFQRIEDIIETSTPDISAASGNEAVYQYGEDVWLVGSGNALLVGNNDDTFAVHTGFGEIMGQGGDDIIFSITPRYIFEGQPIYPGVEDSPIATEDMFMEIDGGSGNDDIFVVGGRGARVIGGAGQDLIFSWSERSQIWGNERGKTPDNQGESDMFWWSPGAFVMDADPVDFVSIFGFTLTGGRNFYPGGIVHDSLVWMIGYHATDSGQLLISLGPPDVDTLKNVMVIESYDYSDKFGGVLDNFGITSQHGDLSLRFRVWDFDFGIEISLFNSVWGDVVFYLGQFNTFLKGLSWRTNKDPLVLDLDGDGLETVRMSQSRANFDLDDDFFAERTGWISSDDGLLAVDRNADGVIDDISELFGGNNPDGVEQTGFAALSDFDSNLDGVVDANDADFDKLLVWRDLDGDGTGESGDADGFGRELFSLEELGISSISTGSTAFDESTGDTENGRIIASGATLLSEGTYTRTDGSTGAVYEVIFETDTTRTIYRGDNGLASWSPAIAAGSEAGTAINATGRGRMADMAISAANDPLLSGVIAAQLTQMSVAAGAAPDLATLRELAA